MCADDARGLRQWVDPSPTSEFWDAFQPVEERMGFLPNSLVTMARRPEILRAAASLAQATRTGTGVERAEGARSPRRQHGRGLPLLPGAHRFERHSPWRGGRSYRPCLELRDERALQPCRTCSPAARPPCRA